MMDSGVMFSVIIYYIWVFPIDTALPMSLDALMRLMLAQPVIFYIPYFAFAEMHIVMNKTICSCVVCL